MEGQTGQSSPGSPAAHPVQCIAKRREFANVPNPGWFNTTSRKQFTIIINGNVVHTITCVAYRVTALKPINLVQLYDNGELIKVHQLGEVYDLTNVGSTIFNPCGTFPLQLNDINEAIEIGFYGYGYFYNPHDRFRMYINNIDVQDGSHISRKYGAKKASYTCGKCIGIILCIGGVFGVLVLLFWPIDNGYFIATHWIWFLVFTLFLCCYPGLSSTWGRFCCNLNWDITDGLTLSGNPQNGPAIVASTMTAQQVQDEKKLQAGIDAVNQAANDHVVQQVRGMA